jgi:hypothetical protein
MKVYVRAASKKEINYTLAQGGDYLGECYSINGVSLHYMRQLPAGAVVARYLKTSGGNPVAVAWHEWNASKQRCK